MNVLIDIIIFCGMLVFFGASLLAGFYGVHALFTTIRAKMRPENTPIRDLFAERPAEDLPQITLQIPVCNEGELIYHSLRSAVALDYPQDKLQIQICDDSSDAETIKICETFAAAQQARGCRIEHIRRPQREGFKPGNLNHAMKTATGEFIMILDADFHVPPEFLRRNLPFFYDDPKLAAVQSYWTHSNRNANLLTRSTEYSYDLHLHVEQLTWSNWGTWMQFNGSGGIWRRAVLDEMGEWPQGSGIEDVYMSYLVQPKGWKIRFSNATTCIGQLPETVASFRTQQGRWALSCGEIFRTLIGSLLRSDAPWESREQALFKLGGYWAHIAMTGMMLGIYPTLLWLQQHPSAQGLMWLWLALAGLLLVGNGMGAAEASQRAKRGFLETQWANTLLGFQQSGIAPTLATRYTMGLLGVRLRHWKPSNALPKQKLLGFLLDFFFDLALEVVLLFLVVMALYTAGWSKYMLLCLMPAVFAIGILFLFSCPLLPTSQTSLQCADAPTHPPLPSPSQTEYSPPATSSATRP